MQDDSITGAAGDVPMLFALSLSAHALIPHRMSGRLDDAEDLAIGDLDGDGLDDLVLGTEETVSFMLSDGLGGFEPSRHLMGDLNLQSVGILDLDHDGDNDVLVGGEIDSTGADGLLLIENLGALGFAAPTVWQPASHSFYAVSALHTTDLDRDGDDDLIASWRTEPYLVWYENDGTSTWIEHILDEDAGAVTMQSVDLDGDTDIDLLVTGSSRIEWYVNDGFGNFGDPINLGYETDSTVLAVDLDDDDDLDLVSCGYASDNAYAYVWENQGGGAMARTTLHTNLPRCRAPLVADRDGDDLPELMWWLRSGDLQGQSNSADFTFGPLQDLGLDHNLTSMVPRHTQLDADLEQELVVFNNSKVLTVDSTSGVDTLTLHDHVSTSHFSMDVDSDGVDDFVSFSPFAWRPGNTTTPSYNVLTPIDELVRSYAVGDVDDDQDDDLVFATWDVPNFGDPDAFFLMENLGNATFADPVALPMTDEEDRRLFLLDVDEDDVLDLVLVGRYGGTSVDVRLGNGTGGFGPRTPLVSSDVEYVFQGDVDNDTFPDLFGYDDDKLVWFRRESQGVYGVQRIIATVDAHWSIGDLNGDDYPDLVRSDDTALSWQENDQTGFFRPPEALASLVCSSSSLVDTDHDDDLDVLCTMTEENGAAYQIENAGNGVFGTPNLLFSASYPTNLHATDFDGDGDVDFSVHQYVDGLWLFESEGVPDDADGDGVSAASDCDDNDADRAPGLPEICDGRDNDCDGEVPADELDGDNDGVATCEGDCDDSEASVSPNAAEQCGNGIDDDCDGAPLDDELDNDGDGQPVCAGDCDDDDATSYLGAVEICGDLLDNDCDGSPLGEEHDGDGDGFAECAGDCNDDDPTVNPSAVEVCGDAADTDCDGTVPYDELDLDGDGTSTCAGDCNDGDPLVAPGAAERCNGLDDDCNDVIDNDVPDTDNDGICDAVDDCPDDSGNDSDGDGVCDSDDQCVGFDAFGDADGDGLCDDGLADVCVGEDASGDADGDGHCALLVDGTTGDCDDAQASVFPGAPEQCDGLDNSCTGALPDEDGDLDGDGVSICGGDCDDADPLRFAGNEEVCDGVDNDCNGVIASSEADADADGERVCDGDCNDLDANVSTRVPEACDGVDTNCDGVVPDDEADADADGERACAGDCDDDDARVRTGNPEACDGLDNDCDSVIDPDCAEPTPPVEPTESGCGCATPRPRSLGFFWARR